MIIDISKYQNVLDWNVLKQTINDSPAAVKGVYIKATEGQGYIDPNFKKNVIGASATQVPIGFYHFATINTTNILADSAAEARDFYNATKGYAVALPYVLDIEREDIKLSPPDLLKWIQNFFLTLHTLGINDVAIYSGKYFLDASLPANHTLGDTRLWLAAYVPAPPKLPNGWSKAWLWQYSSAGIVPGISGKVDLNKLV